MVKHLLRSDLRSSPGTTIPHPTFGPTHQSMVRMTAMVNLALRNTMVGIETAVGQEFIDVCAGNAPFFSSRDLMRVVE